jgi:glucosamine--fructose-6-phosphate aminotransferase (isomerizing)
MLAEIAEQPAVLERIRTDAAAELARVGRRIARAAPRFVLFAARGTSDHAALYAKYLVETTLGLPAGLASPSTMTLYGARPALAEVLFVAVSQSGGSPDLVDSVRTARECGALTVAVTNNPASALAGAAELAVDVHAGTERAVAATKTYTAELLALYLLFGAVAGLDTANGSAGLAAAAQRTLDAASDTADAAADRYRFAERLVTTARGYSYPTAREAALKLMETSYVGAQAFSGADLLHGPMAMIDSGVPAIAIRTSGAGARAMDAVIAKLQAARADVLAVGPATGLPVYADDVAGELLPVLEILPLQRLAWRLALNRGGNPDTPRGLRKVTETR